MNIGYCLSDCIGEVLGLRWSDMSNELNTIYG